MYGKRALCMLLLMLSDAGAAAADDQPGDIEPAVDTSADAATNDAALSSAEAYAERDEIEPAVTSAALAADVTRRQIGTDRVMDEIELSRSEITGNQELPKVLYIVPWQKSDPGELMGRPVNTLLDEVLAPLDREEFLRQVNYYGDLNGGVGEQQ